MAMILPIIDLLKAKITSSSAFLEAIGKELINHFEGSSVNIIHTQTFSHVKHSEVFEYFCPMTTKRYIKIGSDPANDIQLTGPSIQPFHALILQNTSGQVYLSACVAQANILLNTNRLLHTEVLFADDTLQIGETIIDLKSLISWPEQVQKIGKQALVDQNVTEPASKRGLSLQLILIYTAVALLLILMAFYV
jgi:hypothetical protein